MHERLSDAQSKEKQMMASHKLSMEDIRLNEDTLYQYCKDYFVQMDAEDVEGSIERKRSLFFAWYVCERAKEKVVQSDFTRSAEMHDFLFWFWYFRDCCPNKNDIADDSTRFLKFLENKTKAEYDKLKSFVVWEQRVHGLDVGESEKKKQDFKNFLRDFTEYCRDRLCSEKYAEKGFLEWYFTPSNFPSYSPLTIKLFVPWFEANALSGENVDHCLLSQYKEAYEKLNIAIGKSD